MYCSRYRPISDSTGRTGEYRTFQPEKRNSTSTKTERKNRRKAWFEQTQCSKLPPHWHRRLDLLLTFFFFLFFSSVVLVHCSDFFFFLAEQWTLLCDISFFVWYLKPFYTWLALEMLKTYIFLIKDGLNGSAFYLLFSFEPHVMWCINCITSIEPYSSFFFFLISSNNFLVLFVWWIIKFFVFYIVYFFSLYAMNNWINVLW